MGTEAELNTLSEAQLLITNAINEMRYKRKIEVDLDLYQSEIMTGDDNRKTIEIVKEIDERFLYIVVDLMSYNDDKFEAAFETIRRDPTIKHAWQVL